MTDALIIDGRKEQKPQPDEFWKIAELRKLMNLCDNEMETSTMPLKLRYEGEIKLMQQAEAFGRADERAKMRAEMFRLLEHLADKNGVLPYLSILLQDIDNYFDGQAELKKVAK